jgi:putative ABC transport system permease protein
MASPPSWADRFLEWFCNPDLLEDLQGDLHEIYYAKAKNGPEWRARNVYIWMVLRSFRYSTIKRETTKRTVLGMTQQNFKIALRVLIHDKFNTLLKLMGLTIGIACFVLVGMYVKKELSFDQLHTKKDRIYRVWLKEIYEEDKIFFNAITPLRFMPLLSDNFDEFEEVVQINVNNFLVGEGNNRDDEPIAIISPAFFKVFDFKIVKGNSSAPFDGVKSMLLSKSYATKYFGSKDAIGAEIPVQVGEEVENFTVSAIFEVELFGQRTLDAWFNVGPETYVLLEEEASITTVEKNIGAVVMGYLEGRVDPGVYNIGFQPLLDIHLNADIPPGIAPVGDKNAVYTLGLISLLVLIIACINYTTLSVGQSIRRAKEVGVRKVMGAFRSSLIGQYLSESFIIAIAATAIGVLLAKLSLPVFNQLTDANIAFDLSWTTAGVFFLLALLIGLVSGIYPSFVLARMQTSSILKGIMPSSKNRFQKGMMMFQFMVTVLLISSTLVMQRQLNFMKNKDLGFSYQTTVSVPLYPDPTAERFSEYIGSTMDKGTMLKEKLALYPTIESIGMGSHVFGTSGWGGFAFTDDADNFRRFRVLIADPTYFETFRIKMKMGRPFELNSDLDKRQSVILNQAAVDYFSLRDPLADRLPSREFGDHSIVGVTENFNYSSLHSAVEPLVIVQNIDILLPGISDNDFDDSPIPKLVFRYSGNSLTEVAEIVEKEWKNTFPGEELQLSFVEENMQFLYANEERVNKFVMISTIIAIIIASLGLLGLTVLVINSKVKEIGIRKVVGASESRIFALLIRSFSWQLVLGIVVSIPISYWIMNAWLSDFAYRIPLGADIYVFSGGITILIALGVMSYHAIRAAYVNPIDSLRTE